MWSLASTPGALLFALLSQALLLLATAPPTTVLRVPSSARPGHVVKMLPNHNGVYQMRLGSPSNGAANQNSEKEDLSGYFTVMDQGHVITTQDISHLDGTLVPLSVEYVHSQDPDQSWSQSLSVLVTSEPLPGAQFVNQPYTGSLLENSPPGSPVEKLEDLFNVVRTFAPFANLSLVSGDAHLFRLWKVSSDPESDAEPSLVAMDTFDREQRPDYSVTIAAEDANGVTTHAIVQIHIQDANEHAPTFQRPNYLSELKLPNQDEVEAIFQDGVSKLLSVFASDEDSVDDDVTYSLVDTIDDLFSVHPEKGDIGVNLGAMMKNMVQDMEQAWDFLLEKSYELEVLADDGRGLQGSTFVQVMLFICKTITIVAAGLRGKR